MTGHETDRASSRLWLGSALLLLSLAGCDRDGLPSLSKEQARPPSALGVDRHFPTTGEAETVGSLSKRVGRGTPAFGRLVRSGAQDVVFKDEERTGADRMMTPRTRERLTRLSALVQKEWPGVRLRVTEAWDENDEHGDSSVHYEGRALDLTTSDTDPKKLGRLAGLAIAAKFDWVYYENTHVHASVSASGL